MHQQDSNPVDHAKILLENASQEIQAFDEKNRRTAATFNFFTAISRFDDENRHSRFISSFLDPQGGHGQGSLFLHLFLEALAIQGIDTNRLSEWAVRTEVAFSKDRGRIDILLSGPDGIIGIENKVFAQEGNGQLASYAAALADYSQKSAHLVFLTPEGREPTDKISTGSVNLVECAYDPDASPSLGAWLERCRDAVSEIPRLEIILTQYIEIIRRVSGRTLTMDQQQKVAGLLKDRESLEAAKALEEGLKEKKIDLQYQFWKKLAERVTSGLQSPRNERSGIVWDGGPADYGSARGIPRVELIREHFTNSRNRPDVGISIDTGLTWEGHALLLALEILADQNRPWVTYKLFPRRREEPGSEEFVENVPRNHELQNELLRKEPGFSTSPHSFITSDLILPERGERLDLTTFSGIAAGLTEEDTFEALIAQVTEESCRLVESAAETIATLDNKT